MGRSNFSDEFKRDAVAQITERGCPVAEVSQRLGGSQRSLYWWKRQLGRQTTDVVLHIAVRRRKPKQRVLIHSDQGSQLTNHGLGCVCKGSQS